MHEDSTSQKHLSKLLCYHVSYLGNELASLSEYMSCMKETQKCNYYITGEPELFCLLVRWRQVTCLSALT